MSFVGLCTKGLWTLGIGGGEVIYVVQIELDIETPNIDLNIISPLIELDIYIPEVELDNE